MAGLMIKWITVASFDEKWNCEHKVILTLQRGGF